MQTKTIELWKVIISPRPSILRNTISFWTSLTVEPLSNRLSTTLKDGSFSLQVHILPNQPSESAVFLLRSDILVQLAMCKRPSRCPTRPVFPGTWDPSCFAKGTSAFLLCVMFGAKLYRFFSQAKCTPSTDEKLVFMWSGRTVQGPHQNDSHLELCPLPRENSNLFQTFVSAETWVHLFWIVPVCSRQSKWTECIPLSFVKNPCIWLVSNRTETACTEHAE